MKRVRKSHRVRKKRTFRQRFSKVVQNRLLWFGVSLFLILGFLAYGLLFAGFVQVKGVEVEGTQALDPVMLQEKIQSKIPFRFFGISSSSILLVSGNGIEQFLLAEYPLLEQAEASRNFRSRAVLVQVQERIAEAAWCSEGTCFAVDRAGVAFAKDPEAGLPLLLVERSQPKLGSVLVAPSLMELFLKTKETVRSFEGVSVESAAVRENMLEVRMTEGWVVKLNAAAPFQWQQEKLRAVLRESIQPSSRAQLEYIDVRFGDQAYVKYRN